VSDRIYKTTTEEILKVPPRKLNKTAKVLDHLITILASRILELEKSKGHTIKAKEAAIAELASVRGWCIMQIALEEREADL
jgi:hypothetical protein